MSGQLECFQTTERRESINDIINISESINEKNPRLLRGGAFNDRPADVRSAYRDWDRPVDPLRELRFPPLQDLPLIYFISLLLPPF